MEPSDQELMEQIAKGNEIAFNILHQRYYKKIAYLLVKCHKLPKDIAKVIANDTLFAIWNNLNAGKQIYVSVLTYLMSIAYRQFLNWLKKEKRAHGGDNNPPELTDNQPARDNTEQILLLRDAFLKLTEDEWVVVEYMIEIDPENEINQRAIAKKQGWSLSKVNKLKQSAEKKIRAAFFDPDDKTPKHNNKKETEND